jgi:hypothetical protein
LAKLFIVGGYVMLLIDEGMSMEHMKELKYSEKNLPQCHFMNHNWCFTDLGSDLGHCCVSLAVHGTA